VSTSCQSLGHFPISALWPAIWIAGELIQAFNQPNPQRVQMDVANQLQCMTVLIGMLRSSAAEGSGWGSAPRRNKRSGFLSAHARDAQGTPVDRHHPGKSSPLDPPADDVLQRTRCIDARSSWHVSSHIRGITKIK